MGSPLNIKDKIATSQKVELGYLGNKNIRDIFKTFDDETTIQRLLSKLSWVPMPAIGAKRNWRINFYLPNGEKLYIVTYRGGWDLFGDNEFYETFEDKNDRLYHYIESLLKKEKE